MNGECIRFFAAIRRLNDSLAGVTRRGPTKFKHIGSDATKLGVRRETLYRALTGEWKLPGLLRRYEQLKRRAS